MVTTRSGEVPQYFHLAITQSAVQKEARSILSVISKPPRRSRKKNNAQVLKSLQPLVDPIGKVSKPNETLVLSPASVMNGVPLHAFEVDSELLIRRNPVICTSSTAFRLNAVVCRYDFEGQSSKKPWEASVFGDLLHQRAKPVCHMSRQRLIWWHVQGKRTHTLGSGLP